MGQVPDLPWHFFTPSEGADAQSLPTGAYSATARRGFETPSDPLYAYYESNTVWVRLKDGTLQRTSLDANLNPYVFNIPGIPKTPMQFGLRLNW